MKKYFYTDGNEQFGPFSIYELKKIKLTREHHIWHEGLSEWKLITEVEELKEVLTSIPPPLSSINKIEPKQKPIDNTKKEEHKIDLYDTEEYNSIRNKFIESDFEFIRIEKEMNSGKLVDFFNSSDDIISDNKSPDDTVEKNKETVVVYIDDSIETLIEKTFSSDSVKDQRAVFVMIISIFEMNNENKLKEYIKRLADQNFSFLNEMDMDTKGMIFDKYPFLVNKQQNTYNSSTSRKNLNESSSKGEVYDFFKNIDGTKLLIYNLFAFAISYALGYATGITFGLTFFTLIIALLIDLLIGGIGFWYRSKQFKNGIYIFSIWVLGVFVLDFAEYGEYFSYLNFMIDFKYIGYLLTLPSGWYFILANRNL